MIIKNIPETVYKQAALEIGSDGKGIDDIWTWRDEYHHLAYKQGFTDGELERAIGAYLLKGDWSEN